LRISPRITALVLFFLAALTTATAHAQNDPTASQYLRLSAFGGATGTYTGFDDGRNLGITAGADLNFGRYFGLYPSAEVRGTYPIHDGGIDAERNILGGLKVEKRFGRFHPYVDFLVGRGQIDYENGGYTREQITYHQTISKVLSPGVGLDFDVNHYFALKADFQGQRYDTPFGDHPHAKALTAGVVYRFDFNHHPHYKK
jgi:Outer membrane protein beta-barrel domain